MNEEITRNEILNDRKTIHLYFNGMMGLYVAYGISAYLLTKYAKAKPSYSEALQMPVAVVNAEHFEELAKQLNLSGNFMNYRCLKVEAGTDMDEYMNWASELRG